VDDLTDSDVVTREVAEQRSVDQGFCPYELMRWCARRSRVVIGPYGYLFRERVRNAFLASLQVSLSEVDLVVDEAHNLPEHVLDSEASVLSGDDLKWLRDNMAGITKDTGVKWLGEAIQFLYETMMLSLDKLGTGGELKLEKWDVVPRWIEEDVLQMLLESTQVSLEGVDSVPTETPLDRLVHFLYAGSRSVESDDWHVTLEVRRGWRDEAALTGATLKIRPLNAAGLIAPVLRGARSAMLMSGTLRPSSHYATLMGVRNALLEDLASPYPQGSRLVLVDKALSTRYRDRGPSLWKSFAERVSAALSVMPANKSVLIAFPSYQIMQDVLSYGIDCGFRKRLDETPGATIEVIQEAVEEGPHAVFCVYGGKFSEGVDLVTGGSSLLEMIIGVGIPFRPPTSYQKALQEWYEKRFGEGAGYYYSTAVPSIRRVAQLVGRLRRSPSDRGVVVLLDRRFLRYIGMFGPDIAADLWPYSETAEMQSAIRMFNDAEGELSDEQP
jgi:DNA excision repair protein ERCC-2